MTKKERILRAATMLFSRKGFKETSTLELSKLTGVAEGTIFYHFKTKEDLFLAVLERTKELIIEEFESYSSAGRSQKGIDSIEDVVSFYLYLAGKLENQFLLIHRYYPYEIAQTNEVCRMYLEAIYDCLVSIFEETILSGQKDGSISCSSPARKVSLIIFSMIDGIIRFKTYNLYDTGALYDELIKSCRKILEVNKKKLK